MPTLGRSGTSFCMAIRSLFYSCVELSHNALCIWPFGNVKAYYLPVLQVDNWVKIQPPNDYMSFVINLLVFELRRVGGDFPMKSTGIKSTPDLMGSHSADSSSV